MNRWLLFIGGIVLMMFTASITAEAEEKVPDNWIRARCTGYCAKNTRLEGGLYDKIGKLLNTKDRTVAADGKWPYGTRIKIHGTGTWRDDYVWTIRDTGENIYTQSDGTERIDLLMDEEEMDDFGVRYVWIEVVE